MGSSTVEALGQVRKIRPGSVETLDQELAIYDYEVYLNTTTTQSWHRRAVQVNWYEDGLILLDHLAVGPSMRPLEGRVGKNGYRKFSFVYEV